MNKTKTGVAACLAATALLLTACGTGSGTGTVTVTATAPAPAPSAVPVPEPTVDSGSGKDAMFVAVLRSKGNSYIDAATDEKLIELGRSACDVFDSGTTVREYAMYFVREYPDNETMRDLAAYLAGAAIATYCPEYQYQIDAL